MKVHLATITPTPVEVLYKAYRLCYSKGTQQDIKVPTKRIYDFIEAPDNEKMGEFIKKLLPKGHTSPLEHVNITFYISGVSRSLTHQLVRHRTGSYSQQSQRYVKMNQFDYVIPPAIEKDTTLKTIFIEQMESSQYTYDLLVDNLMNKYIYDNSELIDKYIKQQQEDISIQVDNNGRVIYVDNREHLIDWIKETNKSLYSKYEKMAIEDARYVFPNACTSNITVTMDLNNFRKFYALRSCKHAQWEIRELAEKMMEQVKAHIPFADYYAKNCGRTCNECTESEVK